MPCYVCVNLLKQTPPPPRSLPPRSPANGAIGTCRNCSVWACSQHGVRLWGFICAICRPALATTKALGVGGDEAAAEAARAIGATQDQFDIERVEATIHAIVASSSGDGRDDRTLVADLKSVIMTRSEGYLGQGLPPGYLDGVSGAVRTTLAGRNLSPSPDAALIVAGALTMAYALADPSDSDSHNPQSFRPPWRVANPMLLDAIMWLATAAYAEKG